jgi:hypothetical protein
MYHDQVRFLFDLFPNRFRDVRNKNFIGILKNKGTIMFEAIRQDDGEAVHVFMTEYEVEQMIKYLRTLLDEK